VVTFFDGSVEIAGGVVRVFSGKASRLFPGQVLSPWSVLRLEKNTSRQKKPAELFNLLKVIAENDQIEVIQ
jgi:hypothetical protein